MAFLANLCLILFSKNTFWLNQFIFNNNFSYETVEIDQIIHDIMFFRSAMLPTLRNFSQTGYKPPKMKENSETGYTCSTKIPEPLKGEAIFRPPPHQLLIKYPLPTVIRDGHTTYNREVYCTFVVLPHKPRFQTET